MTEAAWSSCTGPEKMLLFLRNSGKHSDRKLRLFAVACCRRIWTALRDERSRLAVEVAERYADGQATDGDRLDASSEACDVMNEPWCESSLSFASATARYATEASTLWAVWVARCAAGCLADADWQAAVDVAPDPVLGDDAWVVQEPRADSAAAMERRAQAHLLRDIFGNPLRPMTLDPAWRTLTVLGFAQRAYHDRHLPAGSFAPVLLVALAAALEQAGCDNSEILGHLRSPGPHVRGCFVVDLILGRT